MAQRERQDALSRLRELEQHNAELQATLRAAQCGDPAQVARLRTANDRYWRISHRKPFATKMPQNLTKSSRKKILEKYFASQKIRTKNLFRLMVSLQINWQAKRPIRRSRLRIAGQVCSLLLLADFGALANGCCMLSANGCCMLSANGCCMLSANGCCMLSAQACSAENIDVVRQWVQEKAGVSVSDFNKQFGIPVLIVINRY